MIGGYLLDTNIPSELMRSVPNGRLRAWVNGLPEETLFLSAITIGEILKGIELLAAGKRRAELQTWIDDDLTLRFSGRVLPATEEICRGWAGLSARRQPSGRPLAMADGLIAATALEHGMTLITRNDKDFGGLGLRLINPWN